MNKWIKSHGVPKPLISDNGVQFSSKEFKDYLSSKEIKHILIPTYSPQSNGITERLNRTIGEVLRLYKGENFNKVLEVVHRRINFTYNTSLNAIPLVFCTGTQNTAAKVIDEVYKNSEDIKKGDYVFCQERSS